MWRYRFLFLELLKRDLQEQYRGSLLGWFWSILTPFFDLAVYSFIFSVLFHSRLSPPEYARYAPPFGVVLLSGLLAYNLPAMVLPRTVNLMRQNANYIKKLKFPAEILPAVQVASGLVNAFLTGVVLIGSMLFFVQGIPWTALLFPLALLPLIFFTLGLGWMLAALGVYVRDLQSFLLMALRIWFFATPIVYSPSVLPDWARPLLVYNPLAFAVSALRDSLLWGQAFSWIPWLTWMLITGGIAFLGYRFFMNLKDGFADVL
jgi:lipopolysaccharide transport system permease protein